MIAPSEPPLANKHSCIGCHANATNIQIPCYIHVCRVTYHHLYHVFLQLLHNLVQSVVVDVSGMQLYDRIVPVIALLYTDLCISSCYTTVMTPTHLPTDTFSYVNKRLQKNPSKNNNHFSVNNNETFTTRA